MTKVLFFEEGERYQVREHPARPEQIIAAINQGQGHRLITWVRPGEALVASRQGDLVIISHRIDNPHFETLQLKSRDLEILQHLGKGETAPQIAFELGIKVRTIRSDIAKMKVLLDAHTIAHLLAKAIALGLIQPMM